MGACFYLNECLREYFITVPVEQTRVEVSIIGLSGHACGDPTARVQPVSRV